MIKNFPDSEIVKMAADCGSWVSLGARLKQFIGKYYTSPAFESYIKDYDYWFTNSN